MTKEEARKWVMAGDIGKLMCIDCRYVYGTPFCFGCPVAWRKIKGKTEYYKEPIPGLQEEM